MPASLGFILGFSFNFLVALIIVRFIDELVFLQRTNQAILLAAIAGIAGAVLMGIVLAKIFLRPIQNLISASKKWQPEI